MDGILKAKRISVGDGARITTSGVVYEGLLMPRIEVGDDNVLILKLQSGYNIGLEYSSSMQIEKMEANAFSEKPTPRYSLKKSSLPKISLIATGGTIASKIDYRLGGVKSLLEPQEICQAMPELVNVISFKSLLSPFKIFSENMSPVEWQKIAALAAKELNSDIKGLVITHGTDTLHFTSAALSFMLKNLCKPVALVGAQRSPDRGSFDGAMNMACAAHYLLSDAAEVAIVMHATSSDDYCYAIRGTKVRKMHTSRRDAFRPVNDLPLAKIYSNGRTEFLKKNYRKRSAGKVVADTAFEKKVALLKAYPGSEPGLVDFLIDKKYKGIVVEATALGQIPTFTFDKKNSWLPQIKRAVEEGIIVAFATQCLYGRTNPFVYETAREMYRLGVIYCEDMLPEVAYVKLGWVLGHTRKKEEVRKLMLTSLAGEINPMLTEEEFLI
ncbi:Glu-tRNA(Gln) amidotransferase subunit GatD [Candidatus Micrarchaeota archaeon]|nr:Glu-tRNA(Gln) amidotransferase subunit GatD [Candidatus Micrarchaeota archaeon]